MTPNEEPPPYVVRKPPADVVAPAPIARRSPWRWVVVVLVVAIAGGAAWYWYTKTPAAEAPAAGKGRDGASRPLPVSAVAAKQGSIDVYVNALGTVTPRNAVVVRSRVDGQLMNVAFKEGQMVKAGELLAEIDPRPFQVQLAQAQGQLAKDEALLNNARVDLDRYRALLAQDSIERQKVDTQESLVRQYQATIQADQAAIDSAKLQLTYARVTAPISGRVGLRQVDPGNVVRASDANGLVVITQLQPITVLYPIPEDNVPRVMRRLQSGETIAVEAWDREQKAKLATGKLLTIDNQIDPATGTVKLRAEFANETVALFPNQFVNVRMLLQTLPDATLVPSAAIQRGAPGTFVYVVKEDRTVTVAPVRLGPVQGETTAIASGVAPGDLVVTDGTDKLREGSRVEIVTRDGTEAAGAPKGGGRGARGDRPGGGRREGGSREGGSREGAPREGTAGDGAGVPKSGG